MGKTSQIITGIIVVIIVIVAGYALYNRGADEKAMTDGDVMMAETGPVKIGAIAPLSGDAAVYGEPISNVIRMAAEEINAAGGVNGRDIELIIEDGKCSGKDAANAMQKLVNVDKVRIVFGGFCSSEALAAEPIATDKEVLLFSPSASSPDLTGISTYFVRNYPSDASQGESLAETAYNDKQWRTIAFIQEQLDYPLGVYNAFHEAFTALGGETLREEFSSDVTDFRTQLTKLRAANADALFISTQTPAAAETILRQMSDIGWQPNILVSDATSGDSATVERNAAMLEGALAAEFGTDPTNQKFQQMLSNYQQRYGTEMEYQSYGQTGYDVIYMLRDAIAAVGENTAKIAAWLRDVDGWQGASGTVDIGENGDRVGGHTVKVIRNGNVEIYSQ